MGFRDLSDEWKKGIVKILIKDPLLNAKIGVIFASVFATVAIATMIPERVKKHFGIHSFYFGIVREV